MERANGLNKRGRHAVDWIQAALGLAALAAVLVARNVPPDFPTFSSTHSETYSKVGHDQRPRFNCETATWSMPADCFAPRPPYAQAELVIPTAYLVATIQTKGFRYNRPPPSF